jgi:adenylate cyclase
MSEEPKAARSWFTEFRRRRMFRAMVGYLLGAWLLLQVANVTFPPLGVPDWVQRALIIALAVGIIPAFALAWIFDITVHGIVRTGAARDVAHTPAADDTPAETPTAALVSPGSGSQPSGTASSPVASARLPLAAEPPTAGTASIAILPFADLSSDKDQDWFCDGLAEEIIDALCCVRGLRVASRTASFRFRDGSVDPREIGTQLRVGAILEGSVRKSGDQLRISAQLIDATSGFHLWSETFDRRLEDVFAIQSEIARRVSAALRVSLTGEVAARIERYATRNMRAHEFYLRGRQLVRRVGVLEWRQSPAMFRRAIELDPEYAAAYAGLADVLAQLLLWRFVKPEEVLPEATRAAHRALDLAPDLAEAHVALGHVRSLTGDNEGATRSFERALELNPELFEAHYYFARHCMAHGEFARAAELFSSAFAVRPDDFTIPALAIPVLDRIGRHAEAEAMARDTLDGLKHQVELNPDDPRAMTFLAGLYARVGQRQAGIPYVEAALRARPDDYSTLYNAACYYSLAGDVERALDVLEHACTLGGGSRDWIEHDSDLDALRDSTRFKTLLAGLSGDATAAQADRPATSGQGSDRMADESG